MCTSTLRWSASRCRGQLHSVTLSKAARQEHAARAPSRKEMPCHPMWQGIQDHVKRTTESISRAADQFGEAVVNAFEGPFPGEQPFSGEQPPIATGVPVPSSYSGTQPGASPVASGVPVAAAGTSAAGQACFALFLLPNATSVLVRGLVGAAQHNGEQGLVVGYDLATARYTVRLVRDGSLLRVKHANLLQRLPVELLGLRERAHLNGRSGVIVGSDEASGRYHVRLPASPQSPGTGLAGGVEAAAGETVSLQLSNLLLPAGARVTACNLTGSGEYNGRIGSVASYDRSSARYAVQLSDSHVLRLKPENVSL